MIGGTSMKNYFKQDGYTLLLTLVLVVLLFLVTATFTLASMNQTKQIEKTDDIFVATSLAEMGTEKSFTTIKNFIELEKESLIKKINNTKNNTIINDSVKKSNIENYVVESNRKLLDQVRLYYDQELMVDNQTNKTGFKINIESVDNSTGRIIIKSEGFVNTSTSQQSKTITSTIDLPKNLFEIDDDSETTELEKIDFSDYTSIPNNQKNIYKDNVTFKGGNKPSYNTASLYVYEKNLTFNLNLHQDKLSDVNIFSLGEITFDGHVVLESDSKIQASSITISTNNNPQNELWNSTIVTTNFNVTHNVHLLKMNYGSKICFTGALPPPTQVKKGKNIETITFPQKINIIDNESYILYKENGKSYVLRKNSSTGKLATTDEISSCKLTFPSNVSTIPLDGVLYNTNDLKFENIVY